MKRKKKPAPEHERVELERQVESLRLDIKKLQFEQLEHDILKKAIELAKKWVSTRSSWATGRRRWWLMT